MRTGRPWGVTFPIAGPVRCRVGLAHRINVVVVPRLLRQQEDVFVGLRAAVGDGLGHGVRFCPDYVLSQIPAVGLERHRNHPRNRNHVLLLEGVRCGTIPTCLTKESRAQAAVQ